MQALPYDPYITSSCTLQLPSIKSYYLLAVNELFFAGFPLIGFCRTKKPVKVFILTRNIIIFPPHPSFATQKSPSHQGKVFQIIVLCYTTTLNKFTSSQAQLIYLFIANFFEFTCMAGGSLTKKSRQKTLS